MVRSISLPSARSHTGTREQVASSCDHKSISSLLLRRQITGNSCLISGDEWSRDCCSQVIYTQPPVDSMTRTGPVTISLQDLERSGEGTLPAIRDAFGSEPGCLGIIVVKGKCVCLGSNSEEGVQAYRFGGVSALVEEGVSVRVLVAVVRLRDIRRAGSTYLGLWSTSTI
jgi:hypothetical protein